MIDWFYVFVKNIIMTFLGQFKSNLKNDQNGQYYPIKIVAGGMYGGNGC